MAVKPKQRSLARPPTRPTGDLWPLAGPPEGSLTGRRSSRSYQQSRARRQH